MKPLLVKLSEDMIEALTVRAEADGCSRSEVIRQACGIYLAEQVHMPEPQVHMPKSQPKAQRHMPKPPTDPERHMPEAQPEQVHMPPTRVHFRAYMARQGNQLWCRKCQAPVYEEHFK